MGERFDGEVTFWGRAEDADFRISRCDDRGLDGTSFTIRHANCEVDFRCSLPGTHNVGNAAAAISVGVTHGVEWEAARKQVREFTTTGLRGVVRRYEEGFVVVDDSYNSNPAALREMIRFVGRLPEFDRRILVAGEMLELGPNAAELHAECGRVAHEAGIDLVVGVRGLAREIVAGAESAGARPENIAFVESAEAAADLVARTLRAGDVVLIKASRGVGLEKVSEVLGRRFAAVES